MIKVTNTTESLGLYQGDTYESEEEMRSLVSDWLLEGGMENAKEREEYISRLMEEVSFEEIPDEQEGQYRDDGFEIEAEVPYRDDGFEIESDETLD